jgi:hypothetical protein
VLRVSQIPELLASSLRGLTQDEQTKELMSVYSAKVLAWLGDKAPMMSKLAIDSAATAELFYVGGEMWQTMTIASPVLPAFELHPDDIPAEIGMVFFEESAPMLVSEESEDFPSETDQVIAISWFLGPGSEPDDGPVLWITPWVRVEEMNGTPEEIRRFRSVFKSALMPLGPLSWHVGTEWNTSLSASSWPAWLMTFFRLLQEAWARIEPAVLDRPTKRRLARMGVAPRTIKVLSLPRREHGPSTGSNTNREWTHRWVVDGHWRNQWYPSQNRHAPKWIHAHLKGPDDKPFLPKDKITRLK